MKAILIDTTKCTGCQTCIKACVTAHAQAANAPADRDSKDGLSAYHYSSILKVDGTHFAKKQCMHCLEPACTAACPVGAIRKTEEGPVVYDPNKCIGCRYCMLACPMSIPRYEWDKKLPYMQKCDMCIDRVREGKTTACVEACPHGVLQFGERDGLLTEARQRIAQNKGKYLSHIYGEK